MSLNIVYALMLWIFSQYKIIFIIFKIFIFYFTLPMKSRSVIKVRNDKSSYNQCSSVTYKLVTYKL